MTTANNDYDNSLSADSSCSFNSLISSDRRYSGIVSTSFVKNNAANNYMHLIYSKKFMYKRSINPNENIRPRPAIEVWRDIGCLLDPSITERSLVVLSDDLKRVLEIGHDSEFEFNIALYNAMRQALGTNDLVDACKTSNEDKQQQEPIVFKSRQHNGFAVAIVREVNGVPDIANNNNDGSRVVANAANIDHGVCLLMQNDGTKGLWKVAHCLCAIELQIVGPKNQCRAIPDDAEGSNNERWLELEFGHGAIAQVMLYIIEWVVPSLAKLGQLGETIPWAIIVGKRNEEEEEEEETGDEAEIPNQTKLVAIATYDASQFNHWVTGNIYVPSACGDNYNYAVTGYEWIPKDPDDTRSAEHALSVYLETILFGLNAAARWLDELHKGTLCQPVATSGTNLRIGTKELKNLNLCGRAGTFVVVDPEAAKCENRQANGEWMINQGEIFRGTLNMQQVTQEVPPEYLVFNTSVADVNVAVKVSSVAVHKYLTHPNHASIALNKIWFHMTRIETVNRELESAKLMVESANRFLESTHRVLEGAKRALENAKLIFQLEQRLTSTTINYQDVNDDERVAMARRAVEEAEQRITDAQQKVTKVECVKAKLTKLPDITELAVHCKVSGLVTVMKDLSIENYFDLRPSNSRSDSLSVLWKGFLKLLEDVLISMANLGIIHPDMRPGYDETSNILYKMEGEGASEKATMKLIDYESISLISSWSVPHGSKGALYFDGDGGAHACLWKQSVAICYAWKTGTKQKDMLAFKLSELEKNYSTSGNSWLGKFYDSNFNRRMTEDLVPHLKDLFTTNSE